MSQLVRGLTFTGATALAVGATIGTGVFFKAGIMSQQVGSPALVLAAWLAAGLLTLAGALTYAELGGMLPQAGGEYVYLRAAYGEAPAFLYGWMRFAVATAGVSALAVGFATFLSAILPMNNVWAERTLHLLGRDVRWQLGLKELAAVAAIMLFGLINCAGVVLGGRVQTALTSAKVLGIGVIVAGAFLLSGTGSPSNFRPAGAPAWSGLQAFGAAVLSALWACDGWAFMPMVAAEVKDPERNVPRALITGVLLVLALYGLANLAYFYVLPFDEVVSANSTRYRDALPVAAKAAKTFLGERGPAIMSFLFMISAAGALNGVTLSSARIPYAMACDGLFFEKFGELGERSRVPVWSIIALSVWSSVLALSGTFDQLTDLTLIGEWIFYGLCGVGVFVLRRTMPDTPRPYRVAGYPVVPMVFVLLAAGLIANSFTTSPVEAVVGVGLIALGLPLYVYFRRRRANAAELLRRVTA